MHCSRRATRRAFPGCLRWATIQDCASTRWAARRVCIPRVTRASTATLLRTSQNCSKRCAASTIEKRTAHFHCSIVLIAHADDPAPVIAEGRWYGSILDTPRGDRGFGYDPIFFDAALKAGAGELDPAVKNRVSHRGQALANLRRLMKSDARA